MQKNNLPPPPDKSSEDSLMKLNFVDAPSIRATDDEGSWCSTGNGASDSDSSSDASVCEVRSPGSKVSPKEKGSSLGISESGSGGIIFGNMDESVLQFGDLLDTEVIFVYWTHVGEIPIKFTNKQNLIKRRAWFAYRIFFVQWKVDLAILEKLACVCLFLLRTHAMSLFWRVNVGCREPITLQYDTTTYILSR